MSHGFVQRGGLWVLAQAVFMGVIGILGITNRNGLGHGRLFLAGIAFLVVAAICGLAGIAALGRSLTPFPKPSATAQLVQHGIYAIIRHPLYTAVFCAAVGWSLIWQSWPALAVSLVLAIFFDAKARHEERLLRDKFLNYAAYERRVRRFIPWLY